MAPHTLQYFPIRERGEMVRMLFAVTGAEFKDHALTFEEFGAMKGNADECPNGFVPILITPCGTKLVQTASILRYIANEFNLHGSTNVERAIIDSILDTIKELHDSCVVYLWATKEEDKPAAAKKLGEQTQQGFKYIEYRASKNENKDVMIGSKLSVVDVYLVDFLDILSRVIPDNKIIDNFPRLKAVAEKTKEFPALKKYLAERK